MTYKEHYSMYCTLHDKAMESLKKCSDAKLSSDWSNNFSEYQRLRKEAMRHLAIYERVSNRKLNTIKRWLVKEGYM